MILESIEIKGSGEVFDGRRALPSKRVISSLGSITNGFLFSTTPIILRILKDVTNNFDASAVSFIASGWLYGSIVGILLFGYIGDAFGYYRGMSIATSLTFIGLFVGAISMSMPPSVIPFVYGFSRILMGIGSGGCIPIAYTRTSKSTRSYSTSHNNESSQVGSVLLLLQSCSWLFGPILFYLFLKWFPSSPKTVLQSLLFVASLPSFISLILLLHAANTIIYSSLQTVEPETVELLKNEEETVIHHMTNVKHVPIWRAFLMTGVTWLIYDYNSYGNTFFSKQITVSLIPFPNTHTGVTIPLILAGLFGVPGQLAVYLLLKKLDVRQVQRYGFIVLSLLFGIVSIGLSSKGRQEWFRPFLFVIYYMTFFFSTCGPGSTTFILPSLLYERDSLSFYHGICTCMGKLGGALGTTLFPAMIAHIGVVGSMFVCSILSLIASLLSYNCLLTNT